MIGVLGGGQLGRMLALAAARLGFDVTVLEPEPDCPASRVCARTITAPYDDPAALEDMARTCPVVTFEFENVPAPPSRSAGGLRRGGRPVRLALAIAQDRVDEKTFLRAPGRRPWPSPQSAPPPTSSRPCPNSGAPLLKTRREGYDGKGQTWVQAREDAHAAFARIGEQPAILEAPADFRRELSVIAARGRDGRHAPLSSGREPPRKRRIAPHPRPRAGDPPETLAQAEAIAATRLRRWTTWA